MQYPSGGIMPPDVFAQSLLLLSAGQHPRLTEVNARGPLSGDAGAMKHGVLLWIVALVVSVAHADEHERELVRLVRQDCGSCHGMQLTGGLGLPLTPQALRDKAAESLVATVIHGRPGTPMPAWKSILSAEDAEWIVKRLIEGFPQEER